MAKLANEFSWSASRDSLFKNCKRAYYYNYYGSWGGWDRYADEYTRKLYVLKNMKTLEMWAGSIVHEVIAESLQRYSQKRTEIVTRELQTRARTKLRSGWMEAVNKEWLAKPKKNNLFGLYYGDGKTLPKERTEAIKELIYNCLAAFTESELLKEILAASPMSWKPIDQLDSFQLDGLKIWAAVDFAYTDAEGILHIIDWKTGREKPDALTVQLACYSFFAEEKWYAPLDRLLLAGVFLRDQARVSEYSMTPEQLFEAKDFILKSSNEMRTYLKDPISNTPLEEKAFPLAENDFPCNRCSYREICPKFA